MRRRRAHLHGVDASDTVAKALRDAYESAGMKLDMGKSCVRFKRVDQLAVDAIADAVESDAVESVDDDIELYEASRPG